MRKSLELQLSIKMAYLTGYLDGHKRCGSIYTEEIQNAQDKLDEIKKLLGLVEE